MVVPRFRKPTRLKEFDYREPGPYFVTVCLNERRPLFGEVTSCGVLLPSPAGSMVATTWKEVGRLFPAVLMGDFVVMPDHLHAILTLGTSYTDNHEMELASIVGWFKTVTVKRYGHGVKTLGWLGYSKPLWQRSFHDHIVRDDADSLRCEQYIEGNLARWAAAREHEME